MKELKDKLDIAKIELISVLAIVLILTIVSVGSILVVYNYLKLKQFSYFLIAMTPIELLLYIINKIKNPKINKKEILIFLLYIFTTLSLIGSNSIRTSIWGFMNRYEGLLVCYSYYSTALLASTIKDDYYKKMIIGFIITIGLVNIIYGLLQTNIIPLNIKVRDSWKYARGFQGNSMFFASLMSICYFFIIGILLNSEKKFDWRLAILLLIFTIGNVISGSMALFCTTIFIFILLIIKELIQIKFKNFSKIRFIKIICCILLYILINIYGIYRIENYQKDVKDLSNEITSIAKTQKAKDNYGTGRIYIWKEVLKKSKENLLFGVGIDNLYYSFNPPLIDPASGYSVDKAHNDYLQRLLCEGIFSFICYISLLIIIVLNNYKSNDKIKSILFLGFFAYITQIFFSISVIRVTPIFWIILGLLMYEEEKKKRERPKKIK
ncbi:MAG: O-antigen ligase family protein [Bacilli bacterium]|nr:O-antigen ligase family protein [Bacilli bacterium]